MPNIETFDAPSRNIAAGDGSLAFARAAPRIEAEMREGSRALGGAVSRLGGFIAKEATEYAERSEVSQASARGAQVSAQVLDEWQKTAKSADPHDPEVAARFQEKVLQPLLEKAGEGFATGRGQAVWQAQQARLTEHMTNVMRADMGTMAGDAAKQDFRQQMSFLGGMVVNDPSSLGYALDHLKTSAAATADAFPNLTVAQRSSLVTEMVEKGSQQIEKAHFGSLLAKNTGAAKAMLAAGTYKHLDPGDLASAVKQAERADAADARAARMEARQARVEASNTALRGYFADLVSGDPARVEGMVKRAFTDPKLDKSDALTVHALVDQMERKDAKTDPVVYSNVVERLALPPDDPNSLDPSKLFGMVGKGLSLQDAKVLETRLSRKEDTPAFQTVNLMMKQGVDFVDSVLNKRNIVTGVRDPLGEQAMLGFKGWFLPTLNQLIPRNLPPDEQLARAQKYLSPQSPDYLLKPENVARFANSPEAVDRAIREMTGRTRTIEATPGGRPVPPPPPAAGRGVPIEPERLQRLDRALGLTGTP